MPRRKPASPQDFDAGSALDPVSERPMVGAFRARYSAGYAWNAMRIMELPFSTDGSPSLPDTWVTLSSLCGRRKVPWQECRTMDERLRIVARLLEGEKSMNPEATQLSRPTAQPAKPSHAGVPESTRRNGWDTTRVSPPQRVTACRCRRERRSHVTRATRKRSARPK